MAVIIETATLYFCSPKSSSGSVGLMAVRLVAMKIAIAMAVISLSVRGAFGGPTDSARDLDCQVGQNVTIACHTSLDSDVDWMYKRDPALTESYVYSNGVIYVYYRARFSIESPTTGDYNLVIADVQLSDAGHYECVEDGGFGTRHQVELIVNENEAIYTTIVIQSAASSSKHVVIAVAATIVTAIVIAVLVVVQLVRCRYDRKKKRSSRIATAATGVSEEKSLVPGNPPKSGETEITDISAEHANNSEDADSGYNTLNTKLLNIDLQNTSGNVIGRLGDWDEHNAKSTNKLSENTKADDQEDGAEHSNNGNNTDDEPECQSLRTTQITPSLGDGLNVKPGDGGVVADANDIVSAAKEASITTSKERNEKQDTTGLIKDRLDCLAVLPAKR